MVRDKLRCAASYERFLYPQLPSTLDDGRTCIGAEATRRTPLMPLGELVRRYLQIGKEFGKPVALSAFGLSPGETESLFSGYDEDYHISRFFQFSEAGGQKFLINGVSSTHVTIDGEIRTIL